MHITAAFAQTALLAYILAVVLVGESMCRAEIYRSACRNDATFKFTQKDKMLVGASSIVVSEIAVDGLSWCSKYCIHNHQCLSFNYKKHASGAIKNCQLLSAVQATSGTSFTSATGWVHYEPIAQVNCYECAKALQSSSHTFSSLAIIVCMILTMFILT